MHSILCRSHCAHPINSWLAGRLVQRHHRPGHGGEHCLQSQRLLGRKGDLGVRNNVHQKACLGVHQQRLKAESDLTLEGTETENEQAINS